MINRLIKFILVIFPHFVNAQSKIEFIDLDSAFNYSYQTFCKINSTSIKINESGWYAGDSNSEHKYAVIDTAQLFQEGIIATGLILYYNNDTLDHLSFYCDSINRKKINNYKKSNKSKIKKGSYLIGKFSLIPTSDVHVYRYATKLYSKKAY